MTWLKPWQVVLSGITITVVAALINHFSLSKHYEELAQLQDQIANLDNQIDSLWQQNIEAERKKELAALLSALNPSGRKTQQSVLSDYVASITTSPETEDDQGNSAIAESEAITRIHHHQYVLRDQIDDIYLARIDLTKTRAAIEEQLSQIKNLSLFLQMLGLILVLSRDIFRQA